MLSEKSLEGVKNQFFRGEDAKYGYANPEQKEAV
jgi:hypothetical protein